MLFMCHGTPKASMSGEEQEKAVKLFSGWTPPAGLEIKAHHVGPTGEDFVLVETDSVATLSEAVLMWAPFVSYQVTPVTAVQDGVGSLARACTTRSALM